MQVLASKYLVPVQVKQLFAFTPLQVLQVLSQAVQVLFPVNLNVFEGHVKEHVVPSNIFMINFKFKLDII